jgi:acylphosphatase
MIEWCRKASPSANVKGVTVEDEPLASDEPDFYIK